MPKMPPMKTYKLEDLQDIPKLDEWLEYKHPLFAKQVEETTPIITVAR